VLDVPSVDVHQHLWPEGVHSVLERRSEAPRARWRDGRWRVDLDGEPCFEIDPADYRPEERAQALGVDRALMALSSPVGAEALSSDDALAAIAAWNEAALSLPAALGWWAATPAALSAEDESELVRTAIANGAAGVCLPADRLSTPARAEHALPLLEAVARPGRRCSCTRARRAGALPSRPGGRRPRATWRSSTPPGTHSSTR
jgi:6-methylsalicylate decarboxylase